MKSFIFPQHLSQVLVALISIVLFSGHNLQCNGIRLNPNGGYDIVVGVEDNTPEPMNVLKFLEEIRNGIEGFSTELWKTTHRRFFINSVDVLVPGNWWTVSNFDVSTWQTLLDSEIRITHDVESPNVVNPNPCGTSGLHIELPDKFFNVPRGGEYGPVGKALVNLWARYRFGVWEEHGIPGDTKFPYFYASPSFEPRWEATGCSNEEIFGIFRNIDGHISDRCDPYGAESPDDDCRFIPSPLNSVNSSIMHLHWLDSVTEFCDKKTHNYVAPNRQNLFCGHRSIWEVVRESDDYKSTKICMDNVPQPKFRVLKESRSPELYILLDRGTTVTPEKVLKELMAALVKLVSYSSLEKVNVAVGTYPHANQGRNHSYVREEVGWAPISSVIYNIERVLDESSHPDGPVIRDFGLAIREVAEKIKRRNHIAGTVLLVVKRGAGPNMFDKITFEQEVIASVKEDSNIQVFAIEAQQGDKTPYANLQTLVSSTSGQYHLINDTVNTARKLEKILSSIQEKLEQSSIMNSISSWVTQKQYTTPHELIEIPIYDEATIVKVHLTTSNEMVGSNVHFKQVEGDHATMQSIQKGEWDENHDLRRRTVFTYIISNPKQGSLWSLEHGCHSDILEDCRFFLVVTAHTDRPTPRANDLIFNSQSITIDVSTSAGDYNYVDMSHQGLKVVPLAIFATVEMNRQRVLRLQNVTAMIRLGEEHNNHMGDWTIPLADNGGGLPDVAENDGIYSGVFTPLKNGLYQISVTATGVSTPTGSTFQDIRIVNHAGGLMQTNQINFGCKNSSKPRCTSAVPRGSFSRSQDLPRTVVVENAATFKPGKPTKILDFKVTTFPNFNIEFEFTSPKLLGSDAIPDEFHIYMAPHVDNFIGSTDMTKLLISTRGEPSGSPVKIKFNAASKAVPYYAVEAMYRGQKGGPSNVIGVVPTMEGEIVPSPTTTTLRPSTSTTEFPSPSTTPTTTLQPSTSTTEFPWPSTTPTTESPFPTTTEESEELTDDLTDPFTSTTPYPSSSTTTEGAGTTSTTEPPVPTTDSSPTTTPTTTTEGSGEPTTTDQPITTTDDTGITSSSTTTEAPTTSTTESDLSSTTFHSTTGDPEITSSTITPPTERTSTTEGGTSTTDYTTTPEPTSSTPDEDISAIPTTSNPSSTTTATSSTTSSTEIPTSTTPDPSSTENPTSTTPDSSSSTTSTESPTSTTPDSSSTTTSTESPTSTTPDSSSTTSSTESPTSTTPDSSSTSSTESPTSTTPDSSSTTSSTESPTSTTPDSSSTTSSTESPTSTTPDSSSTTSSTESPTSTTPDSSSTTASTESPTSTTPDSSSTTSSTESPTSTTPDSSSTTASTEIPTSTTPDSSSTTASTEIPTSTTLDPSSTESPTSTTPDSSSTTASTESPTSTTPDSSSTTASTEIPTSTTPDSSSTTSSTELPSTTTQESSSTTVSTELPSTTTQESSSTTSTGSPSSTTSKSSSSTTPQPSSSSLSTSEQVSTPSTPITEPSSSAALPLKSSETMLSILMLSIFYLQVIRT